MSRPAARVTDIHTCPMCTPGAAPHVGGPIQNGSSTVKKGGLPAATVTSMCTCAGPSDVPIAGSKTVFINGRPALRMLDSTSHGGKIISGLPTVLTG